MTSSGVLLFESASHLPHGGIRGAKRDVQANALLAAIVRELFFS